MRRHLIILLVGCLSASWLQPVAGIDSDVVFEDPAREERYRNLIHELRCMVCQNQSIAESNADLAKDLRVQVEEMIKAGRTDEEILAYMTERYGDFIRYRPPMNPRTWLLWGGPALLLIVGLVFLIPALRRRAAITDEEDQG